MTQYLWIDPPGGGDWNDPNNWETLSQPPPVGPPGAGDDVVIVVQSGDTAQTITTDGVTVASIEDNGVTFVGDLTVTDLISGGTLSGGAVTVDGQCYGVVFEGTTLSADTISASYLSAGAVTTNEFVGGQVTGAAVAADTVDPTANGEVVVIAGTLRAKTLDLGQQYAALVVSGGTAVIGSAATLDGPTDGAAGIFVSGGQLNLERGLTLDGGTYLNDGSVVVASAGGLVTTPNLTVGGTGSGRVFVGNSAARLDVTSDFILGESGSGLLTVENGGHVTVGGNMESAVSSGSTATGVISDAAADLIFDQDWRIGVAGTATWTLDGAVTASVGGVTELGVSSGGSGILSLSDAGTTVSAGGGGVIIGGEGTGNLTIGSGALLNDTAGELTLGQAENSKGSLQINNGGSTLIVGDNAVVGAAGSGAIVMDGGSAIFSGTLTLGQSSGATGGLDVTDAAVTLAGDLTVGSAGTGSITVGPGGSIGPGSLSVPAGSSDTITLGAATTGKGTLTVSGTGASVRSLGLNVGGAGGGTLNIGGSGRVTTTGDATVGEAVTSIIQKVTVTSAGAWVVGDDLTLGEAAIATATVSSGGLVQVGGDLVMGAAAAATGILVLSGGLTVGSSTTDSDLRWGGALEIGEDGTGNLTISTDSVAQSLAGGEGLVEIAAAKGANGTLTISGAGSELKAESLAIGGGLTAVGGTGSLALGSGGIAYFAEGGRIWLGGQASVNGELETGGTLTMAGTLSVGGATSGARALAGAGTLALIAGTTTFKAGAALSIAKVTQTGTAGVTVATAGLKYAGVWAQSAGSITVNAGDVLAFTGTGDSFAGTLGGSGKVEFAGGTDTLSGATLSAAGMVINGAAVTLASVIDLTKTLSVTSPDLTIAMAGASLSGGGTLALSNLATNKIIGATSQAATLTNIDDRIIGAGDIGGGRMTLVNDAGGAIVGDSATVALTLDTGTERIVNAGVIASEGAGGVTIKNALVNTGKLEVTSGTLTVAGAVSGAGKVYIAAGTADFQAGFNQTVAFIGTSGELELADSQDYAGEIGGFSLTGGTSLDLGDIGFTSGVTTANFVENGNGAFGTLTVTDGTHTANIRLVGDFASSTFTTKSDGHGGTIVTDPAKSTAAVRSFVDAMAGFAPGAGPGTASPVEAGWSPQPLLAAAQPIGAAARRAT